MKIKISKKTLTPKKIKRFFWRENVFFVIVLQPLKIFLEFFLSDFRVQHAPTHKETPSPSKLEQKKKSEKNQFLVFFCILDDLARTLNNF